LAEVRRHFEGPVEDKNWIKTEERRKSVALGKDILEKEFRKHQLKFNQVVKLEEFKKLCAELSVNSPDDLLAIVGYGKVSPKHIVNRFVEDEEKKREEEETNPRQAERGAFSRPSAAGVSNHRRRRRHGAVLKVL